MLKIGHVVNYPGQKAGDAPITIEVPQELETVPGIPSNLREVDWYSREYPIETLNILERSNLDWANTIRDAHEETREIFKEHNKQNTPLILKARVTGDLEPTAKPTGEDVTELIKAKARELGFCEVGITAFDYRYTYQSRKDWVKFENVICLANEQDYSGTQTIPSVPGEYVHYSTYRDAEGWGLELVDYIRSLGYRGQVHAGTDNSSAYIPMFVNAGLGQMGACGYLLSPHHGNRMRLMLVTTDAKLSHDQPVDFGIHAFCQVCQVCVNRCPGRALMRDKIWWRGIEKNKLYYKRCRPVMARYMGCGICMKVCPVQKYGMANVLEHYAETGQVLGKGTEELEGYTLADKGYFGPGQMPIFDRGFFDMPKGGLEEWALHELKDRFQAAGNQLTDDILEDFKKEFEKALKTDKDYTTSTMEPMGDRDF